MKSLRHVLATTVLVAAAFGAALTAPVAGCGGGDISFGGDDDDNTLRVTFKGNLDSVTPVTSRDIVVFVYTIDDDDDTDRCPCPPLPDLTYEGKAAVLSSGETEFSISGLKPDKFGVVFLLDKAGDQADGEINPGDEIAILDDDDCRLEDVPGNVTVTLNDIDIDFSTLPEVDCTVGNPPADGRARAETILKKTTTGSD